MLLALIFAVIYAVTTCVTVKNLPSGEIAEPKEGGIKELLFALLKNDQAISLSAIIVLFNSAIYLTMNLVLYLFQYDVGDESLYTVFMGISGAFQLLAMMVFYPRLRKRQSNRQIFGEACVFALAGYGLLTLLIFGGKMSLGKLLLPGIAISAANGAAYVLTTIFVAGAVDYGEKKTGRRENSVISSLQTLMVKLSSAFAVFIAGIGIDLVRLSEDAAVQSADTITRLRVLFAVPPLLLMAAAFVLFLRKKDIGRT